MTDPERELRERLRRLERSMPAAVPVHAAGSAPARPRWSQVLLIGGALLAGIVMGVAGMSLLDRGGVGGGSAPAGLHRSARPVAGPVCVAVALPLQARADAAAWTRVWWWPAGPDGCGQRSDFVYTQWTQPMLVTVPGGGEGLPAVQVALTVELRDDSRWRVALTLDPTPGRAAEGRVPTLADAGSGRPGPDLVPLSSLDALEEAAP